MPTPFIRRSSISMLVCAATFAPAFLSADVVAQPGSTGLAGSEAITASDGLAYPVNRFNLRYLRTSGQQPPLEQVLDLPITLGRAGNDWVSPRPGVETYDISLRELNARGTESFRATALQRVLETVRDAYVNQGLMGIFVVQDRRQINERGQDLRAPDNESLDIVITTGVVTDVRSRGAGERFPAMTKGGVANDLINLEEHNWLRFNSPVQPADATDGGSEADLLYREELDDYIHFLNRHPGRQVDLVLAADDELGGVALTYDVTENDPLLLYAEIGNTGTGQTDYVRERFGLIHTQFTEADDILAIDYTTANFEDVHTVAASYERPFHNNRRLRWKIAGVYSEYQANDVGVFNQDFEGENTGVAAELSYNFHQDKDLFVDVIGGVRWRSVDVEQRLFGGVTRGEGEFLTPYVGLRLEQKTLKHSTRAQATLEFQGDLLSNSQSDLNGLGRTQPDDDWTKLRVAARHSFYLEPIINRAGWDDPTTWESSTLAHEILLRFHGQTTFGARVIPQDQDVLGGLYTVRGYPQSVAAGDDSVFGSIEYRFHWPKSLEPEPEPRTLFGKPFRHAPQHVYGGTDHDLIFKAFVDVGYVSVNDAFSFESNEALVGAGIGVDYIFRRNLKLRLDWGFALHGIEERGVADGAQRLYGVATLLF